MNLDIILRIIRGAPAVIAQAPAFKALFDQVVGTFGEQDQDRLKSVYEQARRGSDDAQDDFVRAGRGE